MPISKRVSIACLLLAVVLTGAAAPAQETHPKATPVDGDPFPATLAAVDTKWQVTFAGEGGRREMAATDLVSWGTCAEAGQGPLLVLADGGLLVGEVFEADKEKLTVDSDLFGLVKLPLELLAGVVFALPAERRAGDMLVDDVASADGQSDQLILVNGDQIAGRFEAIREDAVRLETAVGPVDVEIHRTRALLFDPALLHKEQPQGLHAIAGLSDGSRLIARRLLSDGDLLKIDLAGGVALSTALEDLVYFQPLGGRVTYLSDLKAAEYRHLPFLDLHWPYRADRNVTGGMLRSGGRLFLKGLGMHSAARLTYLLEKPYRRFDAELAIDDSTSGGGSVRFRVFVDGTQKYESPTVRGSSPTAAASVDLSGAKRLDLIVDFAEQADEMDRANWLNARLVQ